MAGPPLVYLAGPEVFLPDAVAIGRRKVAVCTAAGLAAHFPLDPPPAPALSDTVDAEDRSDADADADVDDSRAAVMSGLDRALGLYADMIGVLDRCDGLIANLTPFRGPSVDVGTVWELGYAAGRGVPVFVYTSTRSHDGERVAADGLMVEDFDLADNLMLDGAVRATGGEIIRVDGGADPIDRLRHLDGFDAAVRAAADHLLTR